MDPQRQREPTGRPAGRPDRTVQPGFPTGEARLLDVREEAGAVHLVLDTGHAYEVAPGSVPAGVPAVGEVVPPAVIREIALAAERKLIARRVFAMLDRRLQPLARIRRRLGEQGHTPDAVEAVLAQLVAAGVHSDRRYAEAFCRDCLLSRSVGRRYLVQKLRDKQIDPALAATVAAEVLDRETEAGLASRAAAERWRKLRGPADYKALAKVVRHLLGRGFDAGLANAAAREMRPDRRDETDT